MGGLILAVMMTVAARLYGADVEPAGEEVAFEVGEGARTVTLVITDDEGLTDCAEITLAPMDIRPETEQNPLNPDANGRLPLALLSGPELDVTRIDTSTCGSAPAARPWSRRTSRWRM